ncbi:hypothetical protein AB0L41_32820 [Amycolatopsis mediterranei]|uniref:hypothetical protein n=1 Tax=Amycolatopsis mediterranei TaxID=33910 RepID=UPI00343ED99E
MMGRIAAAAGVAAGFVLLSPVVASAAEAPTGNPESMKVTVSGTAMTVTGTCLTEGMTAEAGYRVHGGHEPPKWGVDWGYMEMVGKRQSITFKGVRPGTYEVTMFCHEGGPLTANSVQTITVGKPAKPAQSTQPAKPAPATQPAKPAVKPAPQVGVKPQGAPQTGGGPADDESTATPLLAGGAIALVGAAGAGALVLRRRAARR